MTFDKARCARWQDDGTGCIMQSNFLWKTESNRRYDFGLGNFAGIWRYPHCIFINKIKFISYKFDSVPGTIFSQWREQPASRLPRSPIVPCVRDQHRLSTTAEIQLSRTFWSAARKCEMRVGIVGAPPASAQRMARARSNDLPAVVGRIRLWFVHEIHVLKGRHTRNPFSLNIYLAYIRLLIQINVTFHLEYRKILSFPSTIDM